MNSWTTMEQAWNLAQIVKIVFGIREETRNDCVLVSEEREMCLVSDWVNQVWCESLILRTNHNHEFNPMAHT
jgi:trimethylamine:corrinoid methyltransferase-like protein